MNLYQTALMDKPSISRPDGMCCICGLRPATNRHHIIPRSQGGKDGPTIDVCGFGNNLKDADGRMWCHGMLHQHYAHVFWMDGWMKLVLPEPTRFEEALLMEGWEPVYTCPEIEAMGDAFEQCFGRRP